MQISFYLFIGLISSFMINYFADTLPYLHKIGKPICYSCKNEMDWKGYITGEKCKACGKRYSTRYWFVIGFTILVAFLAGTHPEWVKMPFWISMLLYTYFAVTVVIDIENRLVLHMMSIAGAIGAVIFGVAYNGVSKTLIGGAAGFLIMLFLFLVGAVFGKWLAKKNNREYDDALGFGDVNLGGITGLLVGWPAIMGGLVCAVVAGGVVSLILVVKMLAKKEYKPMLAIPYAPFIVIAAVVILLMQARQGY